MLRNFAVFGAAAMYLPFVLACSSSNTQLGESTTTSGGSSVNTTTLSRGGGANVSGGGANSTSSSRAPNTNPSSGGAAGTGVGGSSPKSAAATAAGETSVVTGGTTSGGATTAVGTSAVSGNTNSGGRAQGGAGGASTTIIRGGSSAGFAGSGGASSSLAGAAGGTTVARHPTCPVPSGAEMPEASVPAGYCAWVFAEGLTAPRGMVADDQGQLVVIETNSVGAVTLLWDENGDRVNQPSERMRIATVSGLNHGVAIHGGYLYASTSTTVYRWPYDGSHSALSNRQTVLSGMPGGGNHNTRTLVFDAAGNLYVNIGSAANLDPNSNRARVVRLDASKVATGNAQFADVAVHADGTRNEVGLRFDSQGRLWGVENGSDDLNRSDLGGDIHTNNPAEELNLFDHPGSFYGYPYCWSEGDLGSQGLGAGTQWAYPSVMNDGIHTDAWCRDPANVRVPALTLQPHTAPLDLLFYQGGSFPDDVVGAALVTYHGSWNRTPATGYKVVVVPFGDDGMPHGPVTPLLESAVAGDTGGGWSHRPVALAMGKTGEVYVTSDADGLIMAIGHE